MWKSIVLLSALLLNHRASAICFDPDPESLLCYDSPGATPQNVDLDEVRSIAKWVRSFQPSQKFYYMRVSDADNCAEWHVLVPNINGTDGSSSSTWLLAKLVGDADTAVTFTDLANSIDGGVNATSEQISGSILGCGTAGGQKYVDANESDPLYQSSTFVNGNWTNKGIVAKIVRIASAKDFL